MLKVEIMTWEYEGHNCQVRTYADPERRKYALNIFTSTGHADRETARKSAIEWLDGEHGGHWQLIA